ncbi:unnamed protein product [Ilex paraguariensis]|uniref:Uncharacterized protein n=1 Tax=Ilex paraguariensis TaxID=185542 RepID=A0ABC8V3H6_9AQUA
MARPNFDALRDSHNSANDLLHSPLTKQSLVHNQQEKWVHQVSEASLRMLEVCSNTKDVLLFVKDHLQDLQSTFRRISIGKTAVEGKFAAYHHHRKRLKKEMLKHLHSINGMKNKYTTSDLFPKECNLTVVVHVLKEVRMTAMSIIETLMSLMSMPSSNRKSNKRSFAPKFTCVNSLSSWEKSDSTALQIANKRLEAVEIAIEEFEVELECIFRRLIQTRVSLLNILTS